LAELVDAARAAIWLSAHSCKPPRFHSRSSGIGSAGW
jgi:hypothetical protein